MFFCDLLDVLGAFSVPYDVHGLAEMHLSHLLEVDRGESFPHFALVLVEDCHHGGEVHEVA